MKLTTEAIARAGLDLLGEVGLSGLTMRAVAKRLDVQAPALYWHVKNKQELLDAMATRMFLESVEDFDAPAPGADWRIWLADQARSLRAGMLRYRDGARVMAGTMVDDPRILEMLETLLRTLSDAGIPVEHAAKAVPVLLNFTVGYTIEEQARLGEDYDENPYRPENLEAMFDPERFPFASRLRAELVSDDTDADFDYGMRVIIAGIEATVESRLATPPALKVYRRSVGECSGWAPVTGVRVGVCWRDRCWWMAAVSTASPTAERG